MMSFIPWILAGAAFAAVIWFLAAFLFKLGSTGRLMLTLGVPAIAANIYAFSREPVAAASGDWLPMVISYFILCLMFAGPAVLVALPIWFLLEQGTGRAGTLTK